MEGVLRNEIVLVAGKSPSVSHPFPFPPSSPCLVLHSDYPLAVCSAPLAQAVTGWPTAECLHSNHAVPQSSRPYSCLESTDMFGGPSWKREVVPDHKVSERSSQQTIL